MATPRQLYYFDADEIATLRGLIERERGQRQNPSGRPHFVDNDPPSPEVYVAVPPVGGIPARTLDDITIIPGSAECSVYRKLPAAEGGALEQVPGLTKTVYNASASAVAAGSPFPIARDKFGQWWVQAGGSGSSACFSGAKVYVNRPTEIPRGTLHVPSFDAARFDAGDYWDGGEKLIAPSDGYYHVGASVGYSADFTSYPGFGAHRIATVIVQNYDGSGGAAFLRAVVAEAMEDVPYPGAAVAVNLRRGCGTILRLAAGDWVQLVCFTDWPAPMPQVDLITQSTSPDEYAALWLYRIGDDCGGDVTPGTGTETGTGAVTGTGTGTTTPGTGTGTTTEPGTGTASGITVTAVGGATDAGPASSLQLLAVPAGPNSIVRAVVASLGANQSTPAVTYGGVAMTLLTTSILSGAQDGLYTYYLVVTGATSADVTATIPGDPAALMLSVVVIDGLTLRTTNGAPGSNTGVGGTPSVSDGAGGVTNTAGAHLATFLLKRLGFAPVLGTWGGTPPFAEVQRVTLTSGMYQYVLSDGDDLGAGTSFTATLTGSAEDAWGASQDNYK